MKKALKDSYKAYGIYTNGEKIVTPVGLVSPLLKEGNTKTGKTVYTFSLLPTNKTFETVYGTIKGSCPCNCQGCYATKGNYNFPGVRSSMAANTVLCYEHLDFVEKAIRAQLDTLPGVDIRIHAAGDFFNKEYADMWRRIASDYANTNKFWTYTKAEYENTFSGLANANIVKSIIPGFGFNFGHIEYVLRAYVELVKRGETPYICRCTFDDAQHCEGCKGCINNKYVLFAEHSTEYKAAEDPLFSAALDIVNAQKDNTPAQISEMIRKILK